MRRALALASATAAQASPNPQVGCVLTRDGQQIAEGAHLYANRDHAEIVALKQAGDRARGATAYVTLEPCSHHGRTSPCADALIAAGISRCLVATIDPNPQVSGQGIARLRAAGVEVEVGLCQQEARTLNNAFAFAITHARPFVTLKAALSVDGMLAPPPSLRTVAATHWLTGPAARQDVQRLRHASDAILTGIGTVLADNPSLTDRTGLPRRRPLLRVVLDSHLRIPLTSTLVANYATNLDDLLIISSPAAPAAKLAELNARSIPVVPLSSPNLPAILKILHQKQCTSLLLEAGSTLNAAFLAANLVDQAILYYAPSELGPNAIPFALNAHNPFALEQRLTHLTKHTIGPDVRVQGLLHDPWPPETP